MEKRRIKENIYEIGAIDWERTLFDALVPLPNGTSYNSYFIRGSEKQAIIDTVDPSLSHVLLDNLKNLRIDHLDYIIVNHAEQDHSGSIMIILERYPQAQVVTNQKCKNLLQELLHVPSDRFLVIEDQSKLSLGDKTLQFYITPWVHWPETMLTHLIEDGILFTCDLFGSHLATSHLFASAIPEDVYEAAKRYYGEIMMPYRKLIKRYIEKIEPLKLKIIAPSHGPVYDNPRFIIDAYTNWTSDLVKNKVVIPYISMHGSTKRIVDYLMSALASNGISVKEIDLSTADIGKLIIELIDSATMIISSPAVLVGAHPTVASAAYLVNALLPKIRYFSIVGSYSWVNKVTCHLEDLLCNIKAEKLPYVMISGLPKDEDYQKLDHLAQIIIKKHQGLT